jgi:hypothetical protein
MPLYAYGELRKRWRYVGVYGAGLMLCAARSQVGPLRQWFWVLWDRENGRRYARARSRPGRSEVAIDGNLLHIQSRDVAVRLALGEGAPIESICESGRGWGWTRKRAGIPVQGTVEIEGRSRQLVALGVDDESAGYHGRRTSWQWSAGVGCSPSGEALAWNLVSGINDPPRRSERAVWLGGEAREPPPVRFAGGDSISFDSGAELRFSAEAELARDDNALLIRSRYRHRFGSFSGSLDGTEIGTGFGVMEEHEALW